MSQNRFNPLIWKWFISETSAKVVIWNTSNKNVSLELVGFHSWRSRAKGQGCFAVWIFDSIFWLFYFTPTLVSRCNALPKKVLKRILQKKRQQQIRDEDVSFILFFIYWVQQPFHGWGSFSWIHWNGWILQLRCQKYVNRFHVNMCPHLVFRASIRVSFLLEVCQSPVRVSL